MLRKYYTHATAHYDVWRMYEKKAHYCRGNTSHCLTLRYRGSCSPGELHQILQGVDLVSGDIRPFEGPIGADNPLHGLKVAMEDLDETFTFNDTRRVEKQVDHAQLRIAEFRRELELNRTDSADRVLDLYWQKLNRTERSLAAFGSDEPGLLHAQEMIALHQTVLASLLAFPSG